MCNLDLYFTFIIIDHKQSFIFIMYRAVANPDWY